MKKKRRLGKLTREQVNQLEPDARFCPPDAFDERLGRLIEAAMLRKIHVRKLSVNPATLIAHVPEVLEKAKVHLVEEPSMREALLRGLLDDSEGAILAYRNDNGDLCSFDDYAVLAVAQDAKIEKVRVIVLGEGDEWYNAKDLPIRIG
jgi:hypothetical protein